MRDSITWGTVINIDLFNADTQTQSLFDALCAQLIAHGVNTQNKVHDWHTVAAVMLTNSDRTPVQLSELEDAFPSLLVYEPYLVH